MVNETEGFPSTIGRYLKRLILLPHTATEAAERSRAIEAALAARDTTILASDATEVSSPPMAHEPRAFPSLAQHHVAGAVLYADREAALDKIPPGGRVAEIGVALGGYSEVILNKLKPSRFDAFDLFRLHEVDFFWGKHSTEWLGGRTHKAHYEDRFRDAIQTGVMHLHEGDSSLLLAQMPDASYDMIYIDGDHSYEGALKDADVAARKLAPGGLLVFNDYIMTDHVTGAPYGVVPVVHEFCVNRGWTVAYLALQQQLFCDIGLQKR